MSKINIDEKSKSIRKYAGRTIALEKQNYKTRFKFRVRGKNHETNFDTGIFFF
jgi:hypothetical protein